MRGLVFTVILYAVVFAGIIYRFPGRRLELLAWMAVGVIIGFIEGWHLSKEYTAQKVTDAAKEVLAEVRRHEREEGGD